MVRTLPLAAISVLVACAFVLAPAANAATATVQIRSTGFSPGALTIDKGDRVTWRNVDKVDHQVVADDGAFASPILRPNQSWTSTLGTAGTFRYHDALRPKLTAKVTVKGPPPSVALSLSAPIVYWGTPVTLSGTISSGAVNQSVQLYHQPFGQAAPTPLATVTTGANGAFSYALTPNLYTTYTAKWGNVTSGSVVVQVAPKMRLLAGADGYMKAVVSSPVSLWRRHVTLQRLSPFGQWVTVANLMLGEQNGRMFKPAAYLPRGRSVIRVFLSINQAGIGLLASHSGTQAVRRK
ncbi:MAG TPA: cupredoxin domain-containing protein [Gaiellaceae bacterium]|nr:cupredoxin domain-containing protein [Gaiellaceae bacterium]